MPLRLRKKVRRLLGLPAPAPRPDLTLARVLAAAVPPFRLAVASLDDCSPGRSAGLDVVCDGILRGSPFVYPSETLPPIVE